jgi:quercetin dioxygenase-like cupin family protein
MNIVVSSDSLPLFEVGPKGSSARFFHGEQHELTSVSLMLGTLLPGEGPPWHRHPYDEIFVVSEGLARFTIGEEVVETTMGEIVIARAGVPHRFENIGDAVLRMTAVHAAPRVEIEWVGPPTS